MSKKEGSGDLRPYEKPVLLPLGELARGWGAPCSNGSSASTSCNSGNNFGGASKCTDGGLPSHQHCESGGTPSNQCRSGLSR